MKAERWLDEGRLLPGVVVVAIGGNIGTEAQLCERMRSTVHTLSEDWGPAEFSDFYRSTPVGPITEQADFINAVAAFRPEPPIEPEAALLTLQRLELAHGRVRDQHCGPRTLDLDLLLVGQEQRSHEPLLLPHPRMHQRAFVLFPLQELFGPAFRWGQDRPLSHRIRDLGPQRLERLAQ